MRLNLCILRPTGFHNQKRQIGQFSRFCPTDCRKCLYLTIGHPIHQNCLPMGIWAPSNTWFVGAMRAHNPNDIDRFSRFCTDDRRLSTLQLVRPFPPQSYPFPWGSGRPCNTWLLRSPESSTQTASRSLQPFVQGSLVWHTDIRTDRPTDHAILGR